MRADALVVAAGSGVRAGGGIPKQFKVLAGRPMLYWSVAALRKEPRVQRIAVAVDPAHVDAARAATSGIEGVEFLEGGETRTQTVAKGLRAFNADPPEYVLIHDAARPGLDASTLKALFEAIEAGADGAAPGLAATDALKVCDGDGRVLASAPRAGLMRVQTPQAFRFAAIAAAYQTHSGESLEDDLAVGQAAGLSLRIVAGTPALGKVTFPEDFAVIEALMTGAGAPRVGSGYDAHRLGPGDHVMLCGVRIAAERGLIGHSDADVAWHALTDAILGALALGDIGDHFPPSDPKWKGAASEVFLRHAAGLARAQGAKIVNVDLTLICERPKIKPHRAAMRAATAAVLEIPLEAVSVKATTTEGMGFTGREEGIAAQAVVMALAAPDR